MSAIDIESKEKEIQAVADILKDGVPIGSNHTEPLDDETNIYLNREFVASDLPLFASILVKERLPAIELAQVIRELYKQVGSPITSHEYENVWDQAQDWITLQGSLREFVATVLRLERMQHNEPITVVHLENGRLRDQDKLRSFDERVGVQHNNLSTVGEYNGPTPGKDWGDLKNLAQETTVLRNKRDSTPKDTSEYRELSIQYLEQKKIIEREYLLYLLEKGKQAVTPPIESIPPDQTV